MIEVQPFGLFLSDCIGSLGAGVLLGMIYHLLRFLTGHSRLATPIRDILFAPIAALLSYSYAVTYSFAGVLRWYILLFIVVGLLSYRAAVLKKTYKYEKGIKKTFLLPIRFLSVKVQHIVHLLSLRHKKQKNVKKMLKKQLQRRTKVLYNSDNS